MNKILKLPLPEPQALQILRDTASDSARLIITHHAIEGVSAGSHVAVVAAIDYKELEENSCYTIVITAYD